MKKRRIFLAVYAVAAMLGQTGCLFRTRLVEMRSSTAPLKTATKRELVDRINSDAAKLKTLTATVNIATSVGGEKKGKVTDFQEISGFVLLRKPDMLRMIGLFPIVRNKAFDMVNEGDRFELWIPATNKFYVGSGEVTNPSSNALENLRPQVIYNALALPEINAQDEIAVLENGTEAVMDAKSKKLVEQPDYVLDIIRHSDDDWYLYRTILFERVNLVPHRQTIYNKAGDIVTEATYQVYKDYNGVGFPNVIEINRPQEEYSIRLSVVKIAINEPLSDEQFALAQPPGAVVIDLDHPNQNAAANSAPSASPTNGNPQKK